MEQGNARLFNAKGMEHASHIGHLLHALLMGRIRDDGCIAEEE